GSGTRLVVPYLDALAAAGELPGGDARVAADAAVELIAGAIEPRARDDRERRRAALRDEVRRHIRGRLGDPLLSIQSIACAHAMSIRALHALFEGSGESVMRTVRAERLRRCRQDLERPDSGTVSEIALRWGLGGSAHFSRVFKREFGLPPSDVRAAALARQSSGTLRATV
ncbi:MAG TPA: helix-turn-helix domain-containing protein, partial [Solirubrobacteraceae bacterium]|nr:helix-turn-helix domain-containing protein [Solirubrobacteraceae bacterium]